MRCTGHESRFRIALRRSSLQKFDNDNKKFDPIPQPFCNHDVAQQSSCFFLFLWRPETPYAPETLPGRWIHLWVEMFGYKGWLMLPTTRCPYDHGHLGSRDSQA